MPLPMWITLADKRQRVRALPHVWRQYITSYADIGLTLTDPRQLLAEYDVWDIYVDADRQIRAFRLAKRTRFGVKAGLSGTDGTPDARRIFRAYLADWFVTPGNYGEVSHKMEHLAFKLGAPIVCAADAAGVLNKTIEIASDGIHYTRLLANIGPVTKVMVGLPKGTPVTSTVNPACPRVAAGFGARRRRLAIDASLDAELTHLACLRAL